MDPSRTLRRALPLVCAAVMVAAPAVARADSYLNIPQIPGDAASRDYPNQIDVTAFSVGVNEDRSTIVTQAGGNGGGGGASKPAFSEFSIQHHIDRASPFLLTSAASGQLYPWAVLTVTKAGGAAAHTFEYLRYCMTGVQITKVSTSYTGPDDPILERFGLGYRTIVETYNGQKPTGAPIPWTSGWNLLTNRDYAACPAPATGPGPTPTPTSTPTSAPTDTPTPGATSTPGP
jgi:type VI secretion system secreted protein Hcp